MVSQRPTPTIGDYWRLRRKRDFRLLWRWLTWQQRWDLLRKNSFEVRGPKGGTYLIMDRAQHNVKYQGELFCFLPVMEHEKLMGYEFTTVPAPHYDKLLAQKLWLENHGLPYFAVPIFRSPIIFQDYGHAVGPAQPLAQRLQAQVAHRQ